MKICDICRKTVTLLQSGPPELDTIEVCGDCFHDLLRRFSIVEQRLAETKRQMRTDTITEWRRQLTPLKPG